MAFKFNPITGELDVVVLVDESLHYWQRNGITLSPVNAGDNIAVDEIISLEFKINDGTRDRLIIDETQMYYVDPNDKLRIFIGEVDTLLKSPSGSKTINITDSGTVLSDPTTATTQSPLDDSTKIATTAYVDTAVSVEDLWDRSGTVLSPSTAGDDITTTGSINGTTLTGDLNGTVNVATTGITENLEAIAIGVDQLDPNAIQKKISIKSVNTTVIPETVSHFRNGYVEFDHPGGDIDFIFNDDVFTTGDTITIHSGDGGTVTVTQSGSGADIAGSGASYVIAINDGINLIYRGSNVWDMLSSTIGKYENGVLTTKLGSSTATTQSALDDSTKIATTAYVDTAVSVEDLWDRTGTVLSPSNAGDDLAIDLIISDAFAIWIDGDPTLELTPTGSYLKNGLGSISVEDTIFNFADGTEDRFTIDATESKLVSPDGTKEVNVNNTGVTTATQSPLDNSTKLATTAYVDTAVSVEDLWDRSGTTLSPSNAGDSIAIATRTGADGDLSFTLDNNYTARLLSNSNTVYFYIGDSSDTSDTKIIFKDKWQVGTDNTGGTDNAAFQIKDANGATPYFEIDDSPYMIRLTDKTDNRVVIDSDSYTYSDSLGDRLRIDTDYGTIVDDKLYLPFDKLELDVPFTEVGTDVTQIDYSKNAYVLNNLGTNDIVVDADDVLYLDGTNYIKTATSLDQLDNWTVAIRFKTDTGGDAKMLVSKDDSGFNNDFGMGLGLGSDANQISLQMQYDSAYHTLFTTETITLGQWYTVVGTYDGTTMKLYVDGVFYDSLTQSDLYIKSDQWAIGARSDNGGNKYTGYIDYVQVTSRALTESEIYEQHISPDFRPNAPYIKADAFYVIGTDDNINLQVHPDSLIYNDGTRDRLLIDSTESELVSPDGTNELSITDTNTTVTGELDVTAGIADGVTATTQSDGDDSTKLATTAYVDHHTGNGIWNRSGTTISPTNPGDDIADINNIDLDGSLYQPAYANRDTQILLYDFAEIGTPTDIYDKSTHGLNDGTAVGSPTVDDAYGKYGTGIRLNGTDQYVVTSTNGIFPTGSEARTVMACVKTDTISVGIGVIFEYGQHVGANVFSVQRNGSTLRIFTSSDEVSSASGAFVADTWYDIAVTYNGTNISAWMNGEKVIDDEALTVATQSGTIPVYVGVGDDAGPIDWWDGDIDYVMVFESELAEEQVRMPYLFQPKNSAYSYDNFRIFNNDTHEPILDLYDGQFRFIDGTNTRLFINENGSWLSDEQATPASISLANNSLAFTDTLGQARLLIYDDETVLKDISNQARINFTSAYTKLTSPDGAKYISITDTDATINDGNYDRLEIASTGETVVRDDSGNLLSVFNTDIQQLYAGLDTFTLTDSIFRYYDGTSGQDRIYLNKTYTEILDAEIVPSALRLEDGSLTFKGNELSTKGAEVVEVWSLDDLPAAVDGVITLEYKFYRFMQGVDFGTTQIKLENGNYVLFEGADVFVTSVTYSGTDPWFIGEGSVRCVGSGLTWLLTADDAVMFDLEGGWGMDYSSIIATGTGASLGEIRAPSESGILLGTRFVSTRSLFSGFKYGLDLYNVGAVWINLTVFIDTDDAVGAMLNFHDQVNSISIEVNEVTLKSATSDFLYLSPTVTHPVNVQTTILTEEQSFFKSGDTGTFTEVADASIGATSTSVIDSSGVARFEFTGPTVYVNQEVVISGFTSNPIYNGTYIVTSTDGSSYFEVSIIDYGSDETGSFLSNSVTLTDTSTTLSDGDIILLDTDMSVAYDTGTRVYNKQTNSVQVNATWSATETGTWDSGSLTEDSKYINTIGNGTQADSANNGSMFVSGNTQTTITTGSGEWDAIDFGTILEGQSISRFKIVDSQIGLMRYTGLNRYKGGLAIAISAYKAAASAVDHKFRLYKWTGTGPFDPIAPVRAITNVPVSISLVSSVDLNPGDEFRIEVASNGTAGSIVISDISVTTG